MKFLTLFATQVNAQIAGDKGLLTGTGSCVTTGDCTLCHIIVVVNNVIKFILGVSGGLTLLAFFIAGIYIMTAQGDSAKIGKGITVIKTAAVGLAFIFFSYAAVNFGLNVLNGSVNFSQPAQLFGGQQWSQLCAEE